MGADGSATRRHLPDQPHAKHVSNDDATTVDERILVADNGWWLCQYCGATASALDGIVHHEKCPDMGFEADMSLIFANLDSDPPGYAADEKAAGEK